MDYSFFSSSVLTDALAYAEINNYIHITSNLYPLLSNLNFRGSERVEKFILYEFFCVNIIDQ